MNTLQLAGACLAICLTSTASVLAADGAFSVAPNAQSINFQAGEAQSTVVPPGRKSECPMGRILITDDNTRPSTNGTVASGAVHWRDLSGGKEGVSTHGPIPNGSEYSFLTNDHDIVTLPNGDVIYETGAGSKRPLSPKPAWFDFAYRFGDLGGPGARSTILVWRSSDCGETFKFVSEIDSASAGHEDCAYPQGKGAPLRKQNSSPVLPTNNESKQPTFLYDMGGTDGQWLGIDRQSDRLVLVEQCVGFIPVPNSQPFRLSETRISKSYVFTSSDEGDSWQQSAGSLSDRWWRINGVSVPKNRMVLAIGANVNVGTKASTGDGWNFGADELVQNRTPGYSIINSVYAWQKMLFNAKTNPTGNVKFNIINWWSLARVPNSNWVLLAASETIPISQPVIPGPNGKPALNQQLPGTVTFGSGLYFFDPDTKNVKTAAPVLPAHSDTNSAIMHLTVIDPGAGPVLLYWYDVDAGNRIATIRGRFILGLDQMSEDFDISRENAKTSSFSLTPAADPNSVYWYGDYKTAAGFVQPARKSQLSSNVPTASKYRYFPVWVQPDNRMYYTEVSVSPSGSTGATGSIQVSGLMLKPPSSAPWRKAQPQARAKSIPWANDLEEEHERVRGPARQTAPIVQVQPETPPPVEPPVEPIRPIRRLHPIAPVQRIPQPERPAASSAETSTLCRFTQGPRRGETQDYAPMTPLPVGSFCQDARGSSGTVVAR